MVRRGISHIVLTVHPGPLPLTLLPLPLPQSLWRGRSARRELRRRRAEAREAGKLMQDKQALEAKLRDVQNVLETVQTQRNELRQQYRVGGWVSWASFGGGVGGGLGVDTPVGGMGPGAWGLGLGLGGRAGRHADTRPLSTTWLDPRAARCAHCARRVRACVSGGVSQEEKTQREAAEARASELQQSVEARLQEAAAVAAAAAAAGLVQRQAAEAELAAARQQLAAATESDAAAQQQRSAEVSELKGRLAALEKHKAEAEVCARVLPPPLLLLLQISPCRFPCVTNSLLLF